MKRRGATILLLAFTLTSFYSCKGQKETVKNRTDAGEAIAMPPSTFGAEAEVIAVTKQTTVKDNYEATLRIDKITGRGSSLIQIVAAGDTIQCLWPTYHPAGKDLAENNSLKKTITAVIGEQVSRAPNGSITFSIKSYRFK